MVGENQMIDWERAEVMTLDSGYEDSRLQGMIEKHDVAFLIQLAFACGKVREQEDKHLATWVVWKKCSYLKQAETSYLSYPEFKKCLQKS